MPSTAALRPLPSCCSGPRAIFIRDAYHMISIARHLYGTRATQHRCYFRRCPFIVGAVHKGVVALSANILLHKVKRRVEPVDCRILYPYRFARITPSLCISTHRHDPAFIRASRRALLLAAPNPRSSKTRLAAQHDLDKVVELRSDARLTLDPSHLLGFLLDTTSA